MKTTSSTYISKETATKRKPMEIYHLWRGSTHWRYTNGDVTVNFGGNDYVPATIDRGSISYNADLEANTLEVTFARVEVPVVEYVALNPVDVVWIEIQRLFRDQAPLEASTVFIGQISHVGIRGTAAKVKAVGFEYFLKQPIPIYRYQPQCNWTLFDSKCTLSAASYKTTTTVTVSDNGLTLTSSDFGIPEDGYFTNGYVIFGDHKRMISYHSGNVITLRYAISTLATGNSVDAYAGCNGYVEQCRDRFNNVVNQGGHPFIPWDNPAIWD